MDSQLTMLLSVTWGIVAVAAGLGIVVLAAQQMLQDLLPLRSIFQRREIPAILRSIAKDVDQRIKILDRGTGDDYMFEKIVRLGTGAQEGTRNVDPARAMDNLVNLATAGKREELFNLPIDQLAGQISVASQTVLDFPRNNPDLCLILSSGSDADDLIKILSPPPQAATATLPPAATATVSPDRVPSPEEVRYIDARNRVAHQVQRNLDALQIHMRYWLQCYLQLWAIGLGLPCALILFWFTVGNPFVSGMVFGQWLICGVLAGFFSVLFANTLDALLSRKGGR